MKRQWSQNEVSCLSNDLKTITKLFLCEQLMTTDKGEHYSITAKHSYSPSELSMLVFPWCICVDEYAAPTLHTALTLLLSTENDLFVVEENHGFYFPTLSSQETCQPTMAVIPLTLRHVFWYVKHGHWLCRVNTRAVARVFSIVLRKIVEIRWSTHIYVCVRVCLRGRFGHTSSIFTSI